MKTTPLRVCLRYLRKHPWLFLAALCCYPLDALTVVLPPYLIQHILDRAIPQHNVRLLYMLCATYLVALFLEYGIGVLSQYLMSVLGQRAMKALRLDLFSKVQHLDASYFDRNPTGKTLTRLTNDIEAMGEMFSSGAVTVVADFISIVAVVGMMLWLDVHLTLVSFLVVPPLVGLAWVFQKYAHKAFHSIRTYLAHMNAFLSEHINGMDTVQAFCQEERTAREFYEQNDAYRKANHKAIMYDAWLYAIVEAIGTTAVAVMVWYGSANLSTHALGAGTLVAFIQYIRRFFIPLRDLSTKYTVLQSGFTAAERVVDLLQEPVLISSPPNPIPCTDFQHSITLKNVSFAYRTLDEKPVWILRDFNLTLHKNQRIALVGSTGSGKTTVLKLLNRTYDVQEGQVLIDGVDIRTMALEDVRQLFGVVLQDVFLFSGTVLENLTFFGKVPEEKALHAVHAMQAEHIIQRLPNGYHTHLHEMGHNLSSGEKQLLALVRALAFDPKVIILDEATSSIDSDTEAKIQQALRILLHNRTAVVVAHRLSTIEEVDNIIVMKDGACIEQGTHTSLLKQKGFYHTLYHTHTLSSSTMHAP
jgi:ATP-binding cassette subfamily B multidrug efflux pump